MANAWGGFDAGFVAQLSQRLTCPLCQMSMKDPQLTTCGHNFCESCLTASLIKTSSFLPCLQRRVEGIKQVLIP